MGIYYISLTCATERMRTGYQDVDEVVEPLSVRQQKNGGWQPSHLHGEIILWSITNTLFSAYLSFTAKLFYLFISSKISNWWEERTFRLNSVHSSTPDCSFYPS